LISYPDTSFLVSLYSLDTNSALAERTLRDMTGELYITTLVELEIVNAINLRVFRKDITTAQAHASLNNFEEDLQAGLFHLKALPEHAFARAGELSRQTTTRLGTRTADLLHVAAAIELGANRFFTFDRQQRKLAATVKLKLNSLS
jgi:predicted nucleic acid-binding protein